MPNDEKWTALLTEWERQNREFEQFESTLSAFGNQMLGVPNEALHAIDDACADAIAPHHSASIPLSIPLGFRG